MSKRVISVVSGKGGVGKTTTAVNIASLLSLSGRSTVVVDADVYNPCVFFHLGLPHPPTSLQSLLEGKADVEDVLALHPQTGLRCISSSIGLERCLRMKNLKKVLDRLDYNYVIIDCAPGFSEVVEDVIAVSDTALVLMTPEIPSCMAAMKLNHFIKRKKPIRDTHFVLNRVANQNYELHRREVEHFIERPLAGIIPEDVNIPKSIAAKTPVVLYRLNCPSARAFKKFCPHAKLDIRSFRPAQAGKGGFFSSILNRFRKPFGL